MCKFGAVMFKKNLLKISIIFICLFAVANHLFYINTNMVDASIPSKEFSKETMPDEVKKVDVTPYAEPAGNSPVTRPIFRKSLTVER